MSQAARFIGDRVGTKSCAVMALAVSSSIAWDVTLWRNVAAALLWPFPGARAAAWCARTAGRASPLGVDGSKNRASRGSHERRRPCSERDERGAARGGLPMLTMWPTAGLECLPGG